MSLNRSNPRGMTLLEVLISMGILAGMAILIATSITTGAQNRMRINAQLERQGLLRDALRVIERDINLAFNHRDYVVEVYNRAGELHRERLKAEREKKAGQDPESNNDPSETPPTPASPPTPGAPQGQAPAEPIPPFQPEADLSTSHFLGSEDSLHFTSLSHVRTQAEVRESDQIQVGYFVRECTSRLTRQRVPCLWRRHSPILDDQVDQGGTELVLVENVRSFELRYLGAEMGEEWQNRWDSGGFSGRGTQGQLDGRMARRFPTAVEVTLEIADPQAGIDAPSLRMTMVALVRFANNPVSSPESGPGPAGGGQAGGGL